MSPLADETLKCDRVVGPGQAAFRRCAAAFATHATAVIIAVRLVPYLREAGHTATFAAAATGSLGPLSDTGRLILSGAVRRAPAAHAATVSEIQDVGPRSG
ncbi:hypothetical protein [Knoellia koreensis]|jgi:hypothetical protein|uniref:Uncharacterized protein n=1 Tax=Knoellia koreensis TaxID=2730921 RepID=A0A849HUM6_9MICO|nr:hypothetical protein [Knoellia sp. DB2414S]NNM48297.1 hypothetical protein [Knoellia sp. DB2414S]